jgi:hypothetical protein
VRRGSLTLGRFDSGAPFLQMNEISDHDALCPQDYGRRPRQQTEPNGKVRRLGSSGSNQALGKELSKATTRQGREGRQRQEAVSAGPWTVSGLKNTASRYASHVATTARRLFYVYAALVVLLNLSVVLPGNPDYASFWGFVCSVTVQGLVVWGLWRQSSLAWGFALLLALLTPLSIYLMAAPWEIGVILVVLVSLLQAVVLAVPLLATLDSSGKPAASS